MGLKPSQQAYQVPSYVMQRTLYPDKCTFKPLHTACPIQGRCTRHCTPQRGPRRPPTHPQVLRQRPHGVPPPHVVRQRLAALVLPHLEHSGRGAGSRRHAACENCTAVIKDGRGPSPSARPQPILLAQPATAPRFLPARTVKRSLCHKRQRGCKTPAGRTSAPWTCPRHKPAVLR